MAKSPPQEIAHGLASKKGLLALDVRPQKLGYAFFDGAQLLDWGIATYRKADAHTGATARRRIIELLDHHQPMVVIQRSRKPQSVEVRKKLAAIDRMMRTETTRRSIEVHTFNTEMLRTFYAQSGCENKMQLAVKTVAWFPELASRLPPKRKIWEHEHNNEVIFDAVAAALAFLKNQETTLA